MTIAHSAAFALAAGLLLAAQAAEAAGNAENGGKIFRRCEICHAIRAGEPNRIGPSLYGLFDREAGKAPGFSYSANLAKADFKWDDAKLDKWLANPQAFLPGARMAFRLTNPQEREDIVAYLHQAAK
ncbi:MAG TPA: c-type cytochrome [Alphaproteobacteria bacterium]|nr:c-type cytochrome [Alphaproteobacteria bacterium]